MSFATILRVFFTVVLFIVIAALVLFVVPNLAALNEPSEPVVLDLAAAQMPFERPVVESHTPLTELVEFSQAVLQTLTLRRLFFAGDFAELEEQLAVQRARALAVGEGTVRYDPFVYSLSKTNLAGVDRCAEWLQVMPESYLAHWVCAELWNSGAWDVRSEKRFPGVSMAQRIMMRERLAESNRLLERAVELDETPVEALSLMASNHRLLGSGLADEHFAQADAVFPRYLPAHRARANHAQPKWGGSEEQVLEVIAHARSVGIDEAGVLDMEDDFVYVPTTLSSPGATRAYWEQAISRQPTRKRLLGLLYDHATLERWKDVGPAAEALIEAYPDELDAYYWLARAKMATAPMEQAREAMLLAAAMGHDDAVQDFIMALIRGGLGIDASYAGPGLPELCYHSAALGSSIGANCLGAAYFEGGSPGVPFARNPAQGYAWHLLAARAGHYNSQFDLGWMLYTGRVPEIDPHRAQELGLFWLRRAAEKDHKFAQRRLDEMGVGRAERVASGGIKEQIQYQWWRLRQQLSGLWPG